MAQRVFLHVGTPKTGTTFLQRVLWAHKPRLRRAGLLLPGNGDGDHYRAAVDVRQEPHRLQVPANAEGAWSSLLPEIEAYDGDAVISHELFAPASAAQAAAAVRDLAQVAREVHLVVTARDLARQLPAEWQEHVKHRSTLSYPAWMSLAWFDRDAGPFSPNGYHLWHAQHLPDLLARWGRTVPAKHVHVVTVPPQGTPREEWWRRFAWLLGVEDVTVDLDIARSNSSVGAEQAEVLRELNKVLADRLPLPGTYTPIVKNFLAHQVLAGRDGRSIRLHTEDHLRAADTAETFISAIQAAGYDVVGDLDELRCGEPPIMRRPRPGVPAARDTPWHGLEKVDPSRVLEETTEALAATLERLAEVTEELKQLKQSAPAEPTEPTGPAQQPRNDETPGQESGGPRGKGVLRRRR
ncbi:hypothetical protein KLP28_11130 [Nocardioidaceae bacterium]|nr:hypothetical protein KLP28_11130 [Nocardioidaceae bacterium]